MKYPKKTYISPKIESIAIDNEISLVMMTWTDEETPPPPPGLAPSMTENSFEENPFGRSDQ